MREFMAESLCALRDYDRFLRDHDFAALHKMVKTFPVSNREPQPGDLEAICDAVAHACIWYPTQTKCLKRSAVATILLRKYGIPAQMVIAALRMPLKSHAWVEVDGRVANDKPEVQAEYLVMERC